MDCKRYDREFKLNAIKLYREGNKSMNALSKDLGVPLSTYSGWIKEFKEQGEKSFPGSGSFKPCNEELFQLRKQLANVTQERDILKKVVAIFSQTKH